MFSRMRLSVLPAVAMIAGSLSACGGAASAPASESGPAVQTVRPAADATRPAQGGTVVYLHPYVEQRENAFLVLVPEGWIAEGGVVRIDPRLGPTNSVGAKIDFAVKKDPAGTVMIHWLPNFTYKDPRALMGGFPVGGNYMGSMVYPLQDPFGFMDQFVLRKRRPRAENLQILDRRPVPELQHKYQQRAVLPNIHYEAGAMTVSYDEGGVRYREKLVTVIENVAGQGLGMWTNHDTVAVRAPETEFDKAAPLLATVEASIKGNPDWVAGENRGAAHRARAALDTQRYLQEQSRRILEHTRQTNAEIRHSNWLLLTGQEDYINPHTGEVEQGSNQYRCRWQNSGGDVIYSDNPDYDPSRDPNLRGRTDYQRSQVRKR